MYIKRISVIVPTYKPQDYLWSCLESIYNQSLDKKLYELIIVLNGEINPFRMNIQNFINVNMKDLDIHFLYTEVAGVSHARNLALDSFNGEYVCFIDDDDYISPSYLEQLLLKSSNNTVCLSNAICFKDKENKSVNDTIYSRIYRENSFKNNITLHDVRQYLSCPVMKIIHRDIIGNVRFDTRFKNGEDTLFMFLISNKIKHIKFSSQDSIYYRRIRENSATTKKRTWFEKFSNVLNLNRVITIAYLPNIYGYNFLFYLTRILGILKTLLKK